MKTTLTTACAALALFTPSVAAAELVWRAPMAPGEEPLQIESRPDGLTVTRPDGLRLTVSGRAAAPFAPTFCDDGDRRLLAVATTNTQGLADLWIWDHAQTRGRLVPLHAPVAARPAANAECAFGVLTTDGAFGVVDPDSGAGEWTAEVVSPVRDMSEHHGGLFLADHYDGWIVGGADSSARVVGQDADAVVTLDAPLRPGAVTGADGVTWALSRRGVLYAFGGPDGVRQVARGAVAPTTSLVRWEGVGLAWGDALGRLVSFDGAELSTTPLSDRPLSRTLLSSSSPEGGVLLAPTSDGWIYNVRADRTWTRARFDAPLIGPAVTSDTHGVTLSSARVTAHLVDLVAPIDHLEDSYQTELMAAPERASLGHVVTSRGVELLDGVPHSSPASLTLRLPDPESPAGPGATADAGDDLVVIHDTHAPVGCTSAGGAGAPAPLAPFIAFGLLGLVGFARRRR
jgi:MYXO-CTERM domain-containing protein